MRDEFTDQAHAYDDLWLLDTGKPQIEPGPARLLTQPWTSPLTYRTLMFCIST